MSYPIPTPVLPSGAVQTISSVLETIASGATLQQMGISATGTNSRKEYAVAQKSMMSSTNMIAFLKAIRKNINALLGTTQPLPMNNASGSVQPNDYINNISRNLYNVLSMKYISPDVVAPNPALPVDLPVIETIYTNINKLSTSFALNPNKIDKSQNPMDYLVDIDNKLKDITAVAKVKYVNPSDSMHGPMISWKRIKSIEERISHLEEASNISHNNENEEEENENGNENTSGGGILTKKRTKSVKRSKSARKVTRRRH
jgi:hypothetical protein